MGGVDDISVRTISVSPTPFPEPEPTVPTLPCAFSITSSSIFCLTGVSNPASAASFSCFLISLSPPHFHDYFLPKSGRGPLSPCPIPHLLWSLPLTSFCFKDHLIAYCFHHLRFLPILGVLFVGVGVFGLKRGRGRDHLVVYFFNRL